MTQGQPFGKYELLQRVSAGGMAEVFRAIHTPTGSRVALKRILPQIAEDEEFIEMFEDEARIASQLEHPHIARCLDFGHVDKTWFITYEYVSGKDLRALFDRSIKNGEFLPLWFVVHVISRIGEGLAYAHARRDDSGSPVSIVHRDVSPMNIIVAFNGDVKLIDFGIAKAKGKLSRTLVGTIKGKFGYMSPEQVRGEEIDQRADIFALGICAWELLTLKRLFQAENEILVLEKIRSTKIEPPSYNNPDVPAELDRIVMKALAKEPTERYRAARELYRDLNNLAQNINGVASREQIAQYMRRVFPEAFAREESTGSFSWPRPEGKSVGGGQVQENRAMAAENKGSSDLDIFEGLGKKGSSSRPPASGVHPPAPPPRPGEPNKKTLLGMTTPVEENGKARPEVRSSPSSAGMQAAKPASSGRTPPPPPPGRGSLPPVVAPPKSGPPSTRPAPAAEANALEMDWDDEEEQTHVFDKDDRPRSFSSSSSLPAAPPSARSAPPPVPSRSSSPTTGPVSTRQVAASSPPAFPPPPPPTQPVAMNTKSTLLGLTAGNPPPPPSRPLGASPPPPPPPSLGSAFSRSSAPPAGLPAPPPTIDPLAPPPPPPPPPTQRGLGLNRTMPVGSTPPPPPPQQVSTVPLPMPGPPPGSLGMPRPTPHLPPPPSRPSQALPPPSRAPLPVAASSRMEETALVRPQPGHWGIWIALAVLIVVVFGGGAGYYFLVPHTGRMVINVTDTEKAAAVARVEVYVDGSKRCETTPCLLDKIDPGSHSVRVFAQGYDQAPDQFVSVEARKEAHADFTVSMTSSAKGTGIKVAGTQAGLRLRVDGRDIGPLPQELHDLQPGNHSVEVVGTERYQSFEKNIIVAENETVDLGTVTLKVIKGKATINLATSGAKVYLVSGSDRRELPSFPISVDITDMSKTWSLEAQKPGYLDYRQPISFDDGQAEKLYNVELTLKGTAPTATNTVVSLPPPTPAPPTPPAPPPTTQQPPAAGDAWITINSIPPSTCYLDGRALGMTPKPKVHVSPGRHSVKFVNSDLGITKDVGVTVGAGETKFAVVNLNN